MYEPRPLSDSTDWDRTSRASSVPAEEAAPPNWDVLIRVLNPPEAPRHPHDDDDDDDTSSVLTVNQKKKPKKKPKGKLKNEEQEMEDLHWAHCA